MMAKDIAAKRNPLFTGERPLAFDGLADAEVTRLTDAQEADSFLAKYMDVIDPVGTYAEYFRSSVKNVDHLLKEVKNYYRKLVVNGDWKERKYVQVLNDIFEKRLVLSPNTLEWGGKMFEKGELASQLREARANRRRRV
jgi:hypothetical protein